MFRLFNDPLHDAFGSWPMAYIPYGGADIGELLAVARAVGDGDDEDFHAAWTAFGDRLVDEAHAMLARGHRDSARFHLLRASAFYGAPYHPLYGEPVDPRLLVSYRRQADAFARGLALADPPATPLQIPFEGTTLPAFLIPAANAGEARRPLLILTNGCDGTMTDMYFASAVAACRRGYHCLLFDGPGQGSVLYEQGQRMRPDGEAVIEAVVDVAVAHPSVDARHIALSGWSLGGYLALRAATAEHRLAACIADPGLWSMVEGFRSHAIAMGATPEQASDFGALDQMWIDRLSASAPRVFDALQCPRQIVRFTAAEGASGHCEMQNRSLFNQRALDWLDDVFEVPRYRDAHVGSPLSMHVPTDEVNDDALRNSRAAGADPLRGVPPVGAP